MTLGGRFPSDLVLRKAGTMSSTADGTVEDDSDDDDGGLTAAAAIVPGTAQTHVRGPSYDYAGKDPYRMDNVDSATVHEQPFVTRPYTPPHQEELAAAAPLVAGAAGVGAGVVGADAYRRHEQDQQDKEAAILQQSQVHSTQPTYSEPPLQTQTYALSGTEHLPAAQHQAPTELQQPSAAAAQPTQPFLGSEPAATPVQSQPQGPLARQQTANYSDWMAPTAAGVAGVGAGALGTEAYRRHQQDAVVPEAEEKAVSPIEPEYTSIAPPEDQPSLSHSQSNLSTISRERSVRASPIGNSIAAIALGNEPLSPPVSPPVSPPAVAASTLPAPAATKQPTLESTETLDSITSEPTPLPTASAIASELTTDSLSDPTSPPLGGNEAKGAHLTGSFFPRVVRHDTNLSISNLHVPGEFK